MIANPAAASHLAELDARFEGHLAALRQRAAHAKAIVEAGAEALVAQAAPPREADHDDIPLWDDLTPTLT